MSKIEATLILPCYNEAEHFAESVSKIFSVLRKDKRQWEVVFIDDKSTDDTKDIIRAFLRVALASPQGRPLQIAQARAIFHRENQGRGATVAHGIRQAKGDIVGFIDIDCEVSPKYIPLFVEKINKGYHVACAKRLYSFSITHLPRWLASSLYSTITRWLFRHQLSDTEAGYKFFKRKAILPILNKVKSNHWFWDTEIMVRAEKAKLRIVHIPTVFLRRMDKTSTVKLLPDTIDYLKNLWRLKQDIR